MIGNSITTNLYEKALDGTWARQKAISNNIANQETPRYKKINVSFEKTLKNEVSNIFQNNNNSQLESLNKIQDSKISITKDTTSESRADGNNVDIESENVEMSKTVMEYYYLVRGITDNYSRLKYAISEGKR
jgi:flagellar basal-body rod protein FlgB